MAMIVVIVAPDRSRPGHPLVVSHGIDPHTLRSVPLPNDAPERLGAVFDVQLGEFVLREPD